MSEVTRAEFDALRAEVKELRDEKDELTETVEEQSEEIQQLQAEKDELADTVEEQSEEIQQLQTEKDDLSDEVSDLRDDLRQEGEQRGREVAETRKDVADLRETVEEADSDGSNPTPNGGETTIQADDLTPVEQLGRADEVKEVSSSASVQRAVTLFKHLDDWGTQVPKGVVLRPADNPLSLLEAACDETLCWKQWYRAAETLEQLSQGAVTFFDSDRHGKMICLHEQSDVYDRVTGNLTASSVATAP